MKQFIYSLFFLTHALSIAQPPVNQNSVTNSNSEVMKEVNSRTDAQIQEKNAVQQKTLNDFVILYNNANASSAQKNPTATNQQIMNSFIQQNFSSSDFEYNISTFMAGNYDLSKKHFLDNAKAMQATNQQVLIQSAGVSFILKDTKTLKSDLKELRNQKFISDDDLSYARDVLLSLPQNSTLITHGITDTYPLLYLQEIENIRKNDVVLIPMILLQSDEYYLTLKNKDLLHLPTSRVINPEFLKEFCKYNKSYHLSLTIPASYFEGMKTDLYPVGLTFGYASSKYQNSKMNQQLWERELQKTIISKSKEKNGRQLSANYLPMLINLYKFYESENNSKQLNTIRATIMQIGVNIGKTNLLNDLGLN